MTRNEEMLFILLREGLKPARVAATNLSCDLFTGSGGGQIDWTEVYASSARQGVMAIAWDGVQRLIAAGVLPPEAQPPRKVKLQWAYNTERIEKRYAKQKHAALRLGRLLSDNGVQAVLFKGLSMSMCYPVPAHRECGDIDLYAADGNFLRIDTLTEQDGAGARHVSPKHSEFTYAEVPFENHRSFTSEFYAPRNREMNRELKESLVDSRPLFGCDALREPGYRFDELFIPAHAANHFANEGIALRHVIDWMLLLRANASRPDMERLKRYGLNTFAGIMNRICRERLGYDLPQTCCVTDDVLYRRVLTDILSQRGKVKYRGLKLLWHKFRRFTSRRWAYPIIGDSFGRALMRTIRAHLLQPEFFFGKK